MNRQDLLQYVDRKFRRKEVPSFRVGDTVRVHVRITEGSTTRIQPFEGVVIAFQGQGGARSFLVRKISFAVGVERSFPVHSPLIEKITVVRSGRVRRAKLYYLKRLAGKESRLQEKADTAGGKVPVGEALSAPAEEPLAVAEGK